MNSFDVFVIKGFTVYNIYLYLTIKSKTSEANFFQFFICLVRTLNL